MLKVSQKITITGESVVNGVSIAGFTAAIKSDDPADITFSSWQNDKQAYKANRTAVRADQAEFEDYAYAKQDELLAEVNEEANGDEAAE